MDPLSRLLVFWTCWQVAATFVLICADVCPDLHADLQAAHQCTNLYFGILADQCPMCMPTFAPTNAPNGAPTKATTSARLLISRERVSNCADMYIEYCVPPCGQNVVDQCCGQCADHCRRVPYVCVPTSALSSEPISSHLHSGYCTNHRTNVIADQWTNAPTSAPTCCVIGVPNRAASSLVTRAPVCV